MNAASTFLRDLAIILQRTDGWLLAAIVIAILMCIGLLWLDWPRRPRVRITPPAEHRVDDRQVFASATAVRRLHDQADPPGLQSRPPRHFQTIDSLRKRIHHG